MTRIRLIQFKRGLMDHIKALGLFPGEPAVAVDDPTKPRLLVGNLDGVAFELEPKVHGHQVAEIAGLAAAISAAGLDGKVLVSPTPGAQPPAGFGVTGGICVDPSNGKFYGPRDPGQWNTNRQYFETTGKPQEGAGGEARIGWDQAAKTAWYRQAPYLSAVGTAIPVVGVPASTLGVDGDFAVDVPSGLIYGPKVGGAWPSARPVIAFASLTATPDFYLGTLPSWPIGGFYFDKDTNAVHQVAGGWGAAQQIIVTGTVIEGALSLAVDPDLTIGKFGDVIIDRANKIFARPKSGEAWPEMPFATFLLHSNLGGVNDPASHAMSAIDGLDGYLAALSAAQVALQNEVVPLIGTVTLPNLQAVALAGGTVNGYNGMAVGDAALATGVQALALGILAKATADGATAIGIGAKATALHSVAVGVGATADGEESCVMGSSGAFGKKSVLLGNGNGEVAPCNGNLLIGNGILACERTFLGNVAGAPTIVPLSNKLIVDEIGQRNQPGEDVWHPMIPELLALLYGNFDADPSLQWLKINGRLRSSLPMKPGQFTVAGLAALVGQESERAYATNGRKVGEGAGVGTGVPVYFSAGAWRVYSTDAPVQA